MSSPDSALGAGVPPDQRRAFLVPCLPGGEEHLRLPHPAPRLAYFPDPAAGLIEPLLEAAAEAALEGQSRDESFGPAAVPRCFAAPEAPPRLGQPLPDSGGVGFGFWPRA